MGNYNSKDKLLETPWRHFDTGGAWSKEYRDHLVEEIKLQLPRGAITSPKIILFGPIMAGKSSFINSISSIDLNRIATPQRTGAFGTSITLKQTRFVGEKHLHKVRIYDTMGLQTEKGGIHITDVIKTVEGNVKPGYTYNTEGAIDSEEDANYYISNPTLVEKCHCVVLVMDAENILQESTDHSLKDKIKEIQLELRQCDAPVVMILTKIDRICEHVLKDTRKVFNSANVEKCVNIVEKLFGITPMNIHPVRNYANETGLDYNMDILILLALQRAVRTAYDFLKKTEDQEIPEEAFAVKENDTISYDQGESSSRLHGEYTFHTDLTRSLPTIQNAKDEFSIMSIELLDKTENKSIRRLRGSTSRLNIYFRSATGQLPRHPFFPEMIEALSSLLKQHPHLIYVMLYEMQMGDKDLEVVKLYKEDIEEISKYEKDKTNITQLCTTTIGRQILLQHEVQFDLEDFQIEFKSKIQSMFGDSIILKLICYDLVKSYFRIKAAYPSILGADKLPSLVCILEKDIKISMFRGFRLKTHIMNDSASETIKSEKCIEQETDEYKRVLKENFKDINQTLVYHSQYLLAQHSNIEGIRVSFLKMSKHDAIQICPCIVVYCRFKSAVPFKEDLFPATLRHPSKNISYQTDIREGHFSVCPYFAKGSRDWNLELAMGCSVGEADKVIEATIGPFVDVIETQETCFLTARHLLSPITRRDDQIVGVKLVQPANRDPSSVQQNLMPGRACGEVIASLFNEEIDAALVRIDDTRKPSKGHFITVTVEELRKAGLSQTQIPTFDNGDILTAAGLHIADEATRRILKIGSTTGLTKGHLTTEEGVVRTNEGGLLVEYQCNGIAQPRYLRKQLLVESFHDQPFCLPGDSGSAVFLLDSSLRLNCIGIVIGIMSDYTAIVTPIQHILLTLGQKYGNRTLRLKQFPEEMDTE